MTSFIVIPRYGSAPMAVERLDVNHWVLPGLGTRQVIYCDVGIRLRLAAGSGPTSRIAFDLGVPFTVAEINGFEDLVPLMQGSADICHLIFGDVNATPRSEADHWSVNDGSGDVRLTRIDRDGTSRDAGVRAAGRPYSLWKVTADAAAVPPDESVYLRFRFTVRRAGSTWSWQRGERRRSHAISDLRVNELRDRPRFDRDEPDLERALTIERVNVFVINQARLKAGRASPQPKYVRILEGDLWDEYARRRLSRTGEPFVATYWTANDVNRDRPFRAFLEVERRRPTATRSAALTVGFVAALMLLVQPAEILSESVLVGALRAAGGFVIALVTAGALAAATRLVLRMVRPGSIRQVRMLIDRLERRRFRRPR